MNTQDKLLIDREADEGQALFEELRARYPSFFYRKSEADIVSGRLELAWTFEVPGLGIFRPTMSLPLPQEPVPGRDPLSADARRLAFTIGLVELVSYWKIACPPQVIVEAGPLDAEQAAWWKTLYFEGLGEFFYRNGIRTTLEDVMDLSSTVPAEVLQTAEEPQPAASRGTAEPGQGVLIPVGGGKDSVVTLERLRPLGEARWSFCINPTPASLACMELADIAQDRRLIVRRTLDPLMLDLNRRGYLNGHTPFSALVAFTAFSTAWLHGLPYVVLSNEASANESSVSGTTVNHQFSKSSRFEHAFIHYSGSYLSPDVHYFSLLRPFSELAIAREFSRYPAYFTVFRSCNVGSKTNAWCGHCAKCLFVSIMLTPFLGAERVSGILGRDVLDDPELSDVLDELCGLTESKPFECVGTVDEVNLALAGIANLSEEKAKLPCLLRHWLRAVEAGRIPGVSLSGEEVRYLALPGRGPLELWHDEHAVPDVFLPYIEDFLTVRHD